MNALAQSFLPSPGLPAVATFDAGPPWSACQERAAAPARYIEALFSCFLPAASSPPLVPLSTFIAHVMDRTRMSPALLTAGLVILSRLRARLPPHARISAEAYNRLLLAALMLAQKTLCDGCHSAADWGIVGQGRYSTLDVSRMERELLQFVGWSIFVSAEEMSAIDSIIYRTIPVPTSVALEAIRRASPRFSPGPGSGTAAPSPSTAAYPSPPSSPSLKTVPYSFS